jgi:ABC-type nickel/cobalt efflux system permease component RcnA
MGRLAASSAEARFPKGHAIIHAGALLLAAACLAAAWWWIAASVVGKPDWAHAWQWVLALQRRWLTDMRSAMASISGGNPWKGSVGLVSVAFAYGVIHAVGPGHGKAVITSYALADSETVRRSIIVSFMAALVQACSAIALVFVGIMIFGLTARSLSALEAKLEAASGVLIACLGVYLLVTRACRMMRSRRALPASALPSAHPLDCSCDHAHFVQPANIAGAWSWRSAWLLAISVGIRPCTGALLLLVFARAQGLLWAGLLGTLAMALGTASTLSILAMGAVGSRAWALRASRPAPGWSRALVTMFVVVASLFLIAIGAAMVLTPPSRPPF